VAGSHRAAAGGRRRPLRHRPLSRRGARNARVPAVGPRTRSY